MTDSMGPGKLVRHMQNPSYTYDEYLICIGLGPGISSVICKHPSYSGPSYPRSPVLALLLSRLFFFKICKVETLYADCRKELLPFSLVYRSMRKSTTSVEEVTKRVLKQAMLDPALPAVLLGEPTANTGTKYMHIEPLST